MGEQRVDDAMELGQVAGLVEIGEPVEGGEGAGLVVGEVQAVQLAERVPGVAQPRVRLEDGFELGALGVVEAVGAAQQQEPGPEHVGVERRREPFGLARCTSRRTAVSPAANQPMTWKRSSTCVA